ncbi:unnamed protein product [Clonostachys rosea f. rosea IK726]|uniref:Uncharacterized protein n=1 Tax=Clonostachys rosea f. rosea IK726 TaxID=1349383 RepID=A0ACA9TDF8_BIOOC|nr:unnamed protein product [Clonostachys rosea f. rosea IK726]
MLLAILTPKRGCDFDCSLHDRPDSVGKHLVTAFHLEVLQPHRSHQLVDRDLDPGNGDADLVQALNLLLLPVLRIAALLDLAVGAVADGDAAHDEVGGHEVRDLLVGLFGFFVGVAVGLGVAHLGELLDGAEGALQGPLDEVDAGGAEGQALLAGDCGRVEASVLSQVFGGHEGQLEVVLDQDARHEGELVKVRDGGVAGGVGGWRGDGGQLADDLGGLV